MEAKKFWHSKAFWLGMVVIALGIAEYIAGLPAGATIPTITAGILGVIFRFLTNTAIAGTPGARKAK